MSSSVFSGRRGGFVQVLRLAVALVVAFLAVPALGMGSASADDPATPAAADQAPHKVVVCKYVSTPDLRERFSHVVIVDDSALPWFEGAFPEEFADAQGRSLALRWAAAGEQAHEVAVSECPVVQLPPVEPPVTEPPATPKKVVVCKYVATPDLREHLSHIIIVSEASLGADFDGTFPFEFTDAHFRSVALRYAAEGEQAHDVPLTACPADEEPPTPIEPEEPGDPIDPVLPPTPHHPHQPGDPTLPELPNTGSPALLGALGGLGAALVAAGLFLTGFGRRQDVA